MYVPAKAGAYEELCTKSLLLPVIPAKAGIHGLRVPLESVLKQGLCSIHVSPWIPAFAGMTPKKNFWCKARTKRGGYLHLLCKCVFSSQLNEKLDKRGAFECMIRP
jgi:hypothetical protein